MSARPPNIRPVDRLHILLVDDDFFLIDALRRGIRVAYPGWTVHEAVTVQDAMRILDRRASGLDAAVCDINMPELSGTKLLKLIRDLFPHVIRVSLSGMLDGPSIVGAAKYAECQLCKPIPAAQLCDRVIEAYCLRKR